MKTLHAFCLGFIEANELYGTHIDGVGLLAAYDAGRRWGQWRLFNRRTRR